MIDRFLFNFPSARPGRWVVFLVCGLLFIPFIFIDPAGAADRKAEKRKIEEGIKKHQIKIQRLEKGIDEQQQQVHTVQTQEVKLLAELQELDTRLFKQKKKLEVLETRIDDQRQLIKEKNVEIKMVQADKDGVQNHLQKRIQAYYKMGDIGFMNVTFSSKSLPELLTFRESFQVLIKYDQSIIAAYRKTIEELQSSVETLEIEQALLEDFIVRNEEEQEKIHLIRDEKEELLSRIKTQSQLHEQAIAELEEAALSLTASLKKLETKEKVFDQTFRNSKGKIPPPIAGTLVAGFKEEVTNRLGIKTISQGIAIKAPNGTIIRAVHDGEVTFSGYLRGYGNTVIVNHGYQYYSVCSRIEKIFAKKGSKVKEGSEIGITGDTATLMSEGLYFEIRKDSTPLNPLKWLDRSNLKTNN